MLSFQWENISGIEASPEGGAWSQHDATLWGALQESSPPPTLILACVEETSAPEVRQWALDPGGQSATRVCG